MPVSSSKYALALASSAVLFACAPTESPDAGVPGDAPSCARYEERLEDACVPVTVTGVASEELSFERAGYTLHGTLVLPETEGEYRAPGVVLVHGSGPSDRNATSSGALGLNYGQDIPVFQSLAEALAQAGLAVYRYDKRTCFLENSEGRCPTSIDDYVGDLDAMRVDDFVADARAAVQALRARAEVDDDDITLIGHSQGASFVPLLLRDEPGVVSGVQLAGISLPIEEASPRQLRDLADYLESVDPTGYASTIAELRELADEDEAAMQAIRDGSYDMPTYQGTPVSFWRSWMDLTADLRGDFLAVEKPLLVLNGDLDFNVAPHHLERFESWAEETDFPHATFALFPDVTHSFITVTGQSIDARFSPAALDEIVAWHRAR